MITVSPIRSKPDMDAAFTIRRIVFVDEQRVPAEEEYDEFETESQHFLAYLDSKPVGTARWRRTSKGVKLERFAVLAEARRKGIGQALVQAVLNDVFSQQPEPIESIYLHAQLTAKPLYDSFGFVPVGPEFDECSIAHVKMVLPGKRMPIDQPDEPRSSEAVANTDNIPGDKPLGPQSVGSQPTEQR